jgi:hypothetical protein
MESFRKFTAEAMKLAALAAFFVLGVAAGRYGMAVDLLCGGSSSGTCSNAATAASYHWWWAKAHWAVYGFGIALFCWICAKAVIAAERKKAKASDSE